MAGVASKNLYELLGNDPDQDPDLRVEQPPVVPIDKPVQRIGKRNAPIEAPAKDAALTTGGDQGGRGRGRGGRGRGGRGRGGFDGNEQAFQDRGAGHYRNRERNTEEDDGREGGRGGRGGRGYGYDGSRGNRAGGRVGPSYRGDRQSRSVHSGPYDQAKQAEKGWGEETGVGELADEQAGEAIAQEDAKDGVTSWDADAPVNDIGEHPATEENAAPAAEVEPELEDKTRSYSDYLAEQAQKKLQLGGNLNVRQANEGSGKDLPEGKEVSREESEYFAGTGGKARRERERKVKEQVVLDHDYAPRQESTFRGGRGGGRGGRGRGEGGGRGDGSFRGEGRGRGGFRGRGEGRGGFRGGRGGAGANLNVSSDSDFPGLS